MKPVLVAVLSEANAPFAAARDFSQLPAAQVLPSFWAAFWVKK